VPLEQIAQLMAGISANLSARGVPTVIAIEASGASHHWAAAAAVI
jgi:hypothetical protein